ncbi:MAG: sulfotransferase domain-containing protein [Geminicoccaceae bacterium]|nr:sulfotransferase domain-containing protein [Geminicoccaceae bacterium]
MIALLRRLEAWRQRRRFLAKRGAMFASADLLVVSHTKSGRTWLRVMLSHLWHLEHGLPVNELVHGDNFKRRVAVVPAVHFERDTRFPPETGELRPRPEQKVLVLVRDPRDVAVSFWFHVRHRASDAELARKRIPLAARNLDLFAFATHPELGVPRVIGFYNRWRRELAELPHATTLRYEDLRADTVGELDRIVRFLGQTQPRARLEAAVAFASFESLRKKEREGFFASDRLGAAGAGEPNEEGRFKVREGSLGGWRKHFTAEQAARLDRLVIETLDPAWGYSA